MKGSLSLNTYYTDLQMLRLRGVLACTGRCTEKRLARALLLVARYGKDEAPEKIIPKISQETLAEMIGITRPCVSFFMNKFRKLGFIQYKGGLHVNSSLLRVILRD